MDINSMTFGVEIECFVPTDQAQARGWNIGGYSAARGCDIPGHGEWRSTRDGTIRNVPYNFTATEVVSPILSGPAGIESLKKMCATLAAMGARVNASCGLHVHVGFPARDENAPALRRLIIHCANVETAIYASTGTHARERVRVGGASAYSQPIKEAYRGAKDTAAETIQGIVRAAAAGCDRYRLLNLQTLATNERETVEFRAFAGTTSAVKIVGYVFMTLGLVQFSHESAIAQPYDPKPTAGQSSRYQGGAGLVSLNRLMMHLGWIAGYKRTKAYGVMSEKRELRVIIKELRRLAKKYDAEVAR